MLSRKLFSSLILSMVLPLTASAATTFDASSLPGGDTVTGITSFDWAQGSVIASGGNQAFVEWANSGGTCPNAGDCVFDVFGHGKLSSFQGTGISSPGLDSSYEITFEIGYSQRVTVALSGAGTTTAVFKFGPNGVGNPPYNLATDAVLSNGSPNFFRMYISTPNSNALAGTGFGDGTLLLAGQVLPVSNYNSNFTANLAAPQPIGGNWGSIAGATPPAWNVGGNPVQSVTGNGGTDNLDLAVNLSVFNPTFFPNQTLVSFLLSNVNQQLAFTSTNPSLEFPEGGITNCIICDGTDGNAALLAVAGNGAHINGGTTGGGALGPLVATNPSIIFQNDSNSPIVTASTPEPETLALLAFGILGIGFAQRHRTRNTS